MNHGVSISVNRASKKYTIYDAPQDRIKEVFLGPLGRHYGKPFWALQDVSFEAAPGETIGVIGRNGSGKSTLLQLIAGVLQPTEGDIRVDGRITALLELGSGFNPEFTGRENVFLNGSILGLPTAEIEERLPEIVAFADIGEFIDQPVKHYSSGMLVRLAFAVQACVNPRILIVDEALSVGDIFFQQKCHAHMARLLENGTTVVLVTHDMGVVEQYSDRVLLLDKGKCIYYGDPNIAVQNYFWTCRTPGQMPPRHDTVQMVSTEPADGSSDLWPPPSEQIEFSQDRVLGGGNARFLTVALSDRTGRACRLFEMGDTAVFCAEIEALEDLMTPCGGVVLTNSMNINVYGKHTVQAQTAAPAHVPRGAKVRFRHEVKLDLAPGEYTFDIGFTQIDAESRAHAHQLSHAELEKKMTRCCQLSKAGTFQVLPRNDGLELPFYGICNLPGSFTLTLEQASTPVQRDARS